jgi:hypothetical protein
MADSSKPGDKLATVQVLQIFAALELAGGIIAFVSSLQTQHSSVYLGSGLGSIDTSTGSDWVAGLVILAGALFIAALLFGFAHIVADVHDIKLARTTVHSDAQTMPPTPTAPQAVARQGDNEPTSSTS